MNTRPNIMLIVGEDTGRLLGCYEHPELKTPNLDRLAAQGCRYDQAFSVYPVCAPSRSAIITGQYPMKIGTHQMRSSLASPPRLFTQELRDVGYYVSWNTKLDFNFDHSLPSGWRDDSAEWFGRLRQGNMPDQPWFAFFNIDGTHESRIWPDKDEYPDREGLNHYTNYAHPGKARPPRTTNPADVPVPPYLPDTPIVRSDIARHADNISALDQKFGQILDDLEASGQADNTIVIFLADHGRGLPREKRWPYSAGVHMPLIIRYPGVLAPSSVDNQLVSWVDLAPTFLSIAGAAIPDDYDGQAFLGDAKAKQPREYIYAARDRMDESFDRVRVIRDERYQYTRNFFPQIPYCQRNQYMENMPTMIELRTLNAQGKLHGDAAVFMQAAKPVEELYDLTTDYHCIHNLADQPELQEVRLRMAAKLEAFLANIDDKGAYPERELVAQGLVHDRIEEYRSRMKPLAPAFQKGYPLGVFEPSDLQDS